MTRPASQTLDAILAARLIGIVRADSADAAIAHGTQLIERGVVIVEVSLTTPGALKAIEKLATNPECTVGVGTCLDAASTARAVNAGARFALAPTAAPGMVGYALKHGLVAIPAAYTPTEALACLDRGAHAVKLFPASGLGPGGLAAIAEALPQIPFVAVGGISADNAREWLSAGAVAVGMGGGLLHTSAAQTRALVSQLQIPPGGQRWHQ